MQALSRGIQVLEALAADTSGGLGVRELSVVLKLPKSAVGRVLKTLLKTGLATQNVASRRYTLGPKAAMLGQAYASRVDVVQLSRPEMLRLRDRTNETVSLNVRFGWTRVCVAQIESLNELRATGEIGRAYPFDTGAPGRVLLSAMTDTEIDHVLTNGESLRVYPSNKRPQRVQILRGLEFIRRNGFTIANQETMPGVCSIAVPILNHENVVIAALGLLIPHERFRRVNQQQLVNLVKDAVRSIERNLGRLSEAASIPRDADHIGKKPRRRKKAET